MTLIELLSRLQERDVHLWVEDGELCYSAPQGMLTVELREMLVAQKEAVIAFLEEARTSIKSASSSITAVSRDGNLPLSFAQQRLWFLDQFDPNNPVYHIPAVIRLSGVLNVSALKQSFDEIIRRHEILRTSFLYTEEQPVQEIAPKLVSPFSLIDLRMLSKTGQEAEEKYLIGEIATRPFDLAQRPLLRIVLLQLSTTEHILLLTMHHIISDGWSIAVLIRELNELYKAFSVERSPSLPPLPIQYADFSHWQRHQLQGKTLEAQLTYWRQQLGTELPLLELPPDYPRPAIQTFQGARVTQQLSPALSHSLRELGRQEDATLFMILLAAFKLLLYRYTGQTDIIVGSPVAGRNRPEVENLIGFFLNILVLRTDLSGDIHFRELIKRIRQVVTEAYTHQDVPFERLLMELQPKRDLSRPPLFQVFFNMLNLDISQIELPGLTAEQLPDPEIGAKFDITLYVEDKASITFVLVYNTDLFAPDRMIEMLAQYELLLTQIVADPNQKIAHYSLVTKSAERHLPNPTQRLSSEWYGAIQTAFSSHAQRSPSRIAVVDDTDTWTYGELDTRANQLARYLRDKGVRSQEVVAIFGHRSASLVWAVLGVLKAGAAFLILDPAYPSLRILDYLRQVQPRAWLQVEGAGKPASEISSFLETLSCDSLTLPSRTVASKSDFLSDYPTQDPEIAVDPDDLAYIAFTSGSTGKPKGVLGRHGSLTHFLPWQTQRFGLNETDRFSMLSALAHDPLQRDIFTAWWVGGRICIPDAAKMGISGWLATWLQKTFISVVHLTPALGRLIPQPLQDSENEIPLLSLLRYAFFVGDKLHRRDVDHLYQIAPDLTIVNTYGATETQRAVSYYIVPDLREDNINRRTVIPLGQGMDDVQLLILNKAQQLVGVGEVGEIHVRSPHLALGYLDDEIQTQHKFITNPLGHSAEDYIYCTGDLGTYLPDGNVIFTGRKDSQLKIRGYRIEPAEVEAILSQHSSIRNAAVVSQDVERQVGERQLIAYIVPEKQTVSTQVLQYFLRRRLPDYMIPSKFVPLEKLPLTPNGKLDRHALPTPDSTTLKPTTSFVLPRNSIEEELANIWTTVLGCERVGVYDDFFKLGGNSLLATLIIQRIHETFQMKLPLRLLFEEPNIAAIAKVIKQNEYPEQEVPEMRTVARGNKSFEELLAKLDEFSAKD